MSCPECFCGKGHLPGCPEDNDPVPEDQAYAELARDAVKQLCMSERGKSVLSVLYKLHDATTYMDKENMEAVTDIVECITSDKVNGTLSELLEDYHE